MKGEKRKEKMNNCNKIETVVLADLPTWDNQHVPDYFLMEMGVEDEETGNIVRSIVRTPSGLIIPNGNFDNVNILQTNNVAVDEAIHNAVENNTILGGYVVNEGATTVIRLADKDHAPQFMMIGEIEEGQAMIQRVGFVNIYEGHHYIIGAQYYIGENGEPVTNSESGYKLFIPLSNSKLMLNMD